MLLEDLPGVGKTTLARAVARATDLAFARVQCTADLLPADVVGTNVFNRREDRFEFRPGPMFANVVLVDEINRASPKTQSGLLECMQERRVTVDVHTHELARPFVVLATQNPVEFEGTYPLPEAQVDRFMARLSLGYPSSAAEAEMLRAHERGDRVEAVEPVADVTEVVARPDAATRVHASDALRHYVVSLLQRTREDHRVELGASPRAGLMLLRAAKARALLQGRDHALPDDVQALAEVVLAHRIVLAPEAFEVRRADVVADAVAAHAGDLMRGRALSARPRRSDRRARRRSRRHGRAAGHRAALRPGDRVPAPGGVLGALGGDRRAGRRVHRTLRRAPRAGGRALLDLARGHPRAAAAARRRAAGRPALTVRRRCPPAARRRVRHPAPVRHARAPAAAGAAPRRCTTRFGLVTRIGRRHDRRGRGPGAAAPRARRRGLRRARLGRRRGAAAAPAAAAEAELDGVRQHRPGSARVADLLAGARASRRAPGAPAARRRRRAAAGRARPARRRERRGPRRGGARGRVAGASTSRCAAGARC